MDLAVRFPDQGRIHLESRFLFSEPDDPKCRQFLERVFQAPEITQITIKSQQGSGEVPRAELGYCPRTHTLKEVVDRVTRLLNPRKSRSRQTNKSAGASSSNGDIAGANGHAKSNGHVNGLNGQTKSNGRLARANGHAHARSNGYTVLKKAAVGTTRSEAENAAVTITSITPERDANGEIRYFRYGTIVTHWEIKHELPGRLRLKNPLLHRKAELCQALERELMSVLGIDYFKTNPLTSTVLIQYDQKQLSREQIVEILETALVNAEHPSQKDTVDLQLPLCTACGSPGRSSTVRGSSTPAGGCRSLCIHIDPDLQECTGSSHRRKEARSRRTGCNCRRRLYGHNGDFSGNRALLVPELWPSSCQEDPR